MERNMSNTVHIRAMTTADLDFVFEVQQQSYGQDYWEKRETFQAMLSLYPRGALLACFGADKAGYLFIHPCRGSALRHLNTLTRGLDENPDTMYIHDVCISPRFQGHGIARRLLDRCDEITEQEGLARQSGVAVQDSLPMWLQRHFTIVKTIANYAGIQSGHYLERSLDRRTTASHVSDVNLELP